MSSRQCLAALALALGCAWSLSPAVALGAGHYTAPAGHETRFSLQGSNGYRVDVWAGDRRFVTIRVGKGGSSAEYRARRSEIGRYGGRARFADLGQVRFRFVPNGRRRRVAPPAWCEGLAATVLEGAVVGRIRFRGEAGYTQVSVDRAQAEVEVWPRWRCRYGGSRRGPRRRAATFDAFQENPPNIDFYVTRFKRRFSSPFRRVLFRVGTGALRGGVQIYRSAVAFADDSTFRVPDPEGAPENVVLEPPPPFSGTGTFHRTSESVFAWDGDLSVSLPGLESLSLTGTSFDTNYCAGKACVSQDSYGEGEPPERFALLR